MADTNHCSIQPVVKSLSQVFHKLDEIGNNANIASEALLHEKIQ